MNVESDYRRGLALLDGGDFFAAHDAFEDAWRAAPDPERDFFQGLVHVAVAWYQAGRGNPVGWQRQIAKAQRRLTPYQPAHRGLDITDLLTQVTAAAYPNPPRPQLRLVP